MSQFLRWAKVASALVVIAVVLPGGAQSSTAPANPGPSNTVVTRASIPAYSHQPTERVALRSETPSEQNSNPYVMLLAGLGLIVFIARRRTKALDAGG